MSVDTANLRNPSPGPSETYLFDPLPFLNHVIVESRRRFKPARGHWIENAKIMTENVSFVLS